MDERIVYFVLALSQYFYIVSSTYFHETSRIVIKPSEASPQSDFGFSMVFQNADTPKLVIGAPRNDFIGKVYQCSIEDVLNNATAECGAVDIDVESLANYTATFPDQFFYLGASIAATSDYFMTCAPLWTSTRKGASKTDAFGTCFVYNGTAHRYKGSFERRLNNQNIILGGTGWTTLVDEANDMMLVAKSSLHGDIMFIRTSNPLALTNSVVLKYYYDQSWIISYIQHHSNLGYGLAAGNFFSNSTVYAFSMQSMEMRGEIAFLEYKPKSKYLFIMTYKKKFYTIKNKSIGSMFGSTLCAVDINQDGRSDLLVGAPAHSDDDGFEYGAVHVYMGGDLESLNDKSRMRSIFGSKEGGRFGTAIASSDIDGEGLAEVFISAPYEDAGLGAVYVLSGYEVHNALFTYSSFRQVQISELKHTQRIQERSYKSFGFSLQIVSDVDNNGCNELAVGSPGSARVLLFRCLPSVNVSISTQLIGAQIVREQDDNFTVAVCVHIGYRQKPENITTKLVVESNIIGDGAYIPSPKFLIDLLERKPSYCDNVTVLLNNNDPADYKFRVTVTDFNRTLNTKDFDNGWLLISSYSSTEKSMDISRHCKGEDCKPKLSMKFNWSGAEEYVLGSTKTESVTIRIRNAGHNSYEACARVRVGGARVARAACASDGERYTCYLPRPLRRNTEHPVNIFLNMSNPLSTDQKISVEVKLYENCILTNFTEEKMEITYKLNTDDLIIDGASNIRTVTDKEIMDKEVSTIKDDHKFLILNNGSVSWMNVYAIISMEKRPFIASYNVSSTETGDCVRLDYHDTVSFKCIFNLIPNCTKKIITSMEILKAEFGSYLIDGKLNTTSYLELYLQPTSEVKTKWVSTVFLFQKELSVKNDKNLMILIAIIVAMLILAGIIFVLYKVSGCGSAAILYVIPVWSRSHFQADLQQLLNTRVDFFKRKQKKKLDVLRESVRRKSVKLSTRDNDGPQNEGDNLSMDIEVVDDSPFEEIPSSTKDEAVLIEETAQVHS